MSSYERTYATGRTVCRVVELLGWLTAVVGAVAFVIGVGMSIDGPLGIISGFPVLAGGLCFLFMGFLAVAGAQFTRAMLDTAEMTRDIARMQHEQLEIMRKIYPSGS